MRDIRIALAVTQSRVGEISTNIDSVRRLVSDARQKGAEWICFPELNVTGYSIRHPGQGLTTEHLSKIHRILSQLSFSEKTVIMAGMVEPDSSGAWYAAHRIFRKNGSSDVYHKTHIAPPEKKVLKAGNTIPVFQVDGITIGIQLCWDTHFPDLSTIMALHGAEILLFPHASPQGTPESKLESWLRHLPARAFDNSVYVVACNQTGDNGEGLSFPGIALGIDPAGKILSVAFPKQEDCLILDLKAEVLTSIRSHRMKYFLPERKPELYRNYLLPSFIPTENMP